MKKSTLHIKGIAFGLLGAMAGSVLAIPLSLVKMSLLDSGSFCKPLLTFSTKMWMTSCGLVFFEDSIINCSAAVFLSGALLGWLSLLVESRRASARQRAPRLRWSFLVPMIFVALLFSIYFLQ